MLRLFFTVVGVFAVCYLFSAVTADFDASTVCEGNNTQFTSTSSSSTGTTIVSYKWDFQNDGVFDDSTGATVSFLYSSAGTYNAKLEVINDLNETSIIVKSVTVGAIPSVNFAFGDFCQDITGQLSSNGVVKGSSISSYDWDLNNDGNFDDANGQQISTSFAKAGGNLVGIQATSSLGCSASAYRLVTVDATPTANFNVGNTCIGNPVEFEDFSVANDGTPFHNWEFGDGSIATSDAPLHTYDAVGDYTVKLTLTSAKGCIDSISKAVTIHAVPSVDFTAEDVCLNEETVFVNTSSNTGLSIKSTTWNFGNGTFSQDKNPNYTYSKKGTYQVTLTLKTDKGCEQSSSKDVEVFANPFSIITASGEIEDCKEEEVILTAPNVGSNSILWSTGATKESITVRNSGTYEMVLFNKTTGCEYRDDITVTVGQIPVLTISKDRTINFGDETTLSVRGAATYQWEPAAGITDLTSNNVVVSPGNETTYYVTGTSANGCVSEEASVTVKVKKRFGLTPMTLFSPNGDGVNDTWLVKNLSGYSSCKVQVFDSWGNLVYESNDPNSRWDGSSSDGKITEGVYYYVINCKSLEEDLTGSVTLVK